MSDKQIEVVVVGSGNVAEALVVAIAECPRLHLREVVGRREERAAELATLGGCDYQTDFAKAAAADLYIIAVSDRAVGEVAATLRRSAGSTLVHTAGSVECDVLGGERCGVLYPFQTFTAGRRVDFGEVPLFVEGSDETTTEFIEEVARALSRRVYRATSEVRREIHLTGVLACNFVNALYAMAADRLEQRASLPFDVLRPLIEQTTRKAVESTHPRMVQTGPAVRGDFTVAERHEKMLGDEHKAQIYKLLTEYIWQTSKKI